MFVSRCFSKKLTIRTLMLLIAALLLVAPMLVLRVVHLAANAAVVVHIARIVGRAARGHVPGAVAGRRVVDILVGRHDVAVTGVRTRVGIVEFDAIPAATAAITPALGLAATAAPFTLGALAVAFVLDFFLAAFKPGHILVRHPLAADVVFVLLFLVEQLFVLKVLDVLCREAPVLNFGLVLFWPGKGGILKLLAKKLKLGRGFWGLTCGLRT